MEHPSNDHDDDPDHHKNSDKLCDKLWYWDNNMIRIS